MSDVSKMKITKSSGNVFADLGLDEAPLLLAKADLAIAISRRIRELGLTQTAAGALMELDQPKVSAIMRGRLEGFSLERLMECLNALDCSVTITIGPARKQTPRLRVRQLYPRKRGKFPPKRVTHKVRDRELAPA
jgi:predicted XRE-type DNA-binding protein